MSHILRRFSCLNAVLLCVFAFCLLPSWAKDANPDGYPLSGKVLSSSSKGAHLYQVETDSRVYLLMCEKTRGFHLGLPDCKVDGKPIAAGDTVRFRVDGDWAYMPVAKGAEDGLRILTTELKVIPPLTSPTATESGKVATPTAERGMVIGTGWHVQGQKQVAWSTNPSSASPPSFNPIAPAPGIAMGTPSAPVMAIAPVTAIPVTGGAPVLVMPTGPVGGGVVTGIPVTGGAPITAIPTGPVMGVPMGAPRAGGGVVMGGGAPRWVHLLRVQAGKHIYLLECSGKPCEVDKKQIDLGDPLAIRAEKKWAYLSSASGSGGKEQRLKILSETEGDATSDAR